MVEVPPGLPHVYSLDGRYLTRTGDRNRLLSSPELTALLLERGEAGFESRAVPGATLDDLDPGADRGATWPPWAARRVTAQSLLLARAAA